MSTWRLARILSGGQTGVDRAALDVAEELGIPRGGWCPRGRRAEDGRIPEKYTLREATSAGYPERTSLNVAAADATLALTRGVLKGGTALTVKLARGAGKPVLVVDLAAEPDALVVKAWLGAHLVAILNVAGPRESEQAGIHDQAAAFLREVLAP